MLMRHKTTGKPYETAFPLVEAPGMLVEPSFRHSDRQRVQVLRWPNDADAIHIEKDQRGEQTRALVAVDERMVPYDVKQVGCSHLVEAVVREVLSERSARLCKR